MRVIGPYATLKYKGNIQGLKLYLKYLKRTHGCVVERIERKDDGFVLFVKSSGSTHESTKRGL
jgi:hypothetical protein